MILHRKIDIIKDRDILLEFHCEINFQCSSESSKTVGYEKYREKWMNSKNQVDEYVSALNKTMTDVRTIADILEDENGSVLGYLWVTFSDIQDYNLTIAELNEIAVARDKRDTGIATYAMKYIEETSREKGAALLRSGTGYSNIPSRKLHELCGFKPYRIEYEKILD